MEVRDIEKGWKEGDLVGVGGYTEGEQCKVSAAGKHLIQKT